MICVLVVLAAAFGSTAKAVNPANWTFYLETSGADVYWTSPTNVDTGYPQYDWTIEVTQMDVLVTELGWLDLISELPPDVLFASGTEYGLPFGSCEYVDEPGVFAADICDGVDALGYGYVSITNISFGSVEDYALEGLRLGGNATVTPEPATITLLGLAGAIVLRRRRG